MECLGNLLSIYEHRERVRKENSYRFSESPFGWGETKMADNDGEKIGEKMEKKMCV